MLSAAFLIGATFALLAVGYSVAYSSMNMVNFAHGEVFMSGGLAGYFVLELGRNSGGPHGVIGFVIAVATGGIVGALIAFALQRLVYRPLLHRDRLSLVLAALGASLFLQQMGLLLLRLQGSGSSERTMNLGDADRIQVLGLTTVECIGLFLLIASVCVVAWLIEMTRFGIRLRAIAFSVDALRRLKQPVDVNIGLAFALGGFVAGAAGVVYAAQYSLSPFMGFTPGIKAFLACIVGGRSIYGAVLGGFAIGVTEGLLSGWLGSAWRDVITAALIMGVLVAKPEGLYSFGKPRTL